MLIWQDIFKLQPGDQFSMRCQQRKLCNVVGLFPPTPVSGAPRWSLCPSKTRQHCLAKSGVATDFQIYSLPGHNSEIASDLYGIFQNEPYRVQDKLMVELYFKKGFMLKEGIFSALYVVAFALGIPAILVASGFDFPNEKGDRHYEGHGVAYP